MRHPLYFNPVRLNCITLQVLKLYIENYGLSPQFCHWVHTNCKRIRKMSIKGLRDSLVQFQKFSNWTHYTISLKGGLLTLEVMTLLLQHVLDHVPGTSNLMILAKVRFNDGNQRTLGKALIIDSNFTLEQLVEYYRIVFEYLNNFYKTSQVDEVWVQTKPVDTPTLIPECDEHILHTFVKEHSILPTTFDYTAWGNVELDDTQVITDTNQNQVKVGSAKVRRNNLLYDISVLGKTMKVAVFNVSLSSKMNVETLTVMKHFTITSLDPNNLTNIQLSSDNTELNYLNGDITKGFYPINTLKVPILPKNVDSSSKKEIITMDIETRAVNKVITPYAVGIYDGSTFLSYYLNDFDSVDSMMESAFKALLIDIYDGRVVYLHNFAGFDSIFLLKVIARFAIKPINKVVMKDGLLISITIHFEYLNSDGIKRVGSLTFRDSILLLPSSLRKLCVAFGNKETKLYFPYDFVNQSNITLDYVGNIPALNYFEDMTESMYKEYCNTVGSLWELKTETLRYLKADVVSLFEVITKFASIMRQDFKIDCHTTPTLPSLAFKVYRTNFIRSKNIPVLIGGVFKDISKAYFGGAVDVFKPYGENLYYYDVNSLYPSVISKKIPVGNPIFTKGNIDLNDFFGFVYADIFCPDNLHIPVLPYKLDESTTYPTGSWSGWYFSEELKQAVKVYGYVVKPLIGYKFESQVLFKAYVNKFYPMKRDGKGAQREIAKMILNSLYGRWGLSPELNITMIVDTNMNNPYTDLTVTDILPLGDNLELVQGISKNKLELSKVLTSVGISAAISAYSRMAINIWKHLPGYTIYYSDTDSLVTDKPLPPAIIGEELGQMKLVNFINKGVFLAPKVYGLEVTVDGVVDYVIKVKGYTNPVDFNTLKSLLSNRKVELNQSKWVKNRELGVFNIVDQLYTLTSTDNKRVLIRNTNGVFIDTRPIRVNNGIVVSSENQA